MFLAQIQSLFAIIDSKPKGFQIDEAIFQQIVSIYCLCDSLTQTYLIEELAKRPVLQFAELYSKKMSGEIGQTALQMLQSINQQTVKLENEKIALFRSRALTVIPSLKVLELSREEWLKAQSLVEERQLKRLTRKTLLIVFSETKHTDISKLINDLTKTSKSRAAKPVFNSNKEERPLKKYRRYIEGENRLMFAGATELHSPLKKTGVRIMSSPPRRVFSEKPKVLWSPGETQKIRPVMTKKLGTFFEPITPEPPTQRTRRTTASAEIIRHQYPGYVYKRPGPISFTITSETMENRKGVKRPTSQRQLTGAPCVEVFKVEGYGDEHIVINGRQCHWSHLIAYFLGGIHSKENLAPTTAAANYNILDTVENFIADKILNKDKEERVGELRLEVTPYYAPENKGHIPDLLYFNLNWTSPKHPNVYLKETIEIKPSSFRRFTDRMQKSFSVFRKVEEDILVKRAEKGDQEHDSPFKPPNLKKEVRQKISFLSFYQPLPAEPQAIEETNETPDSLSIYQSTS
ncbi:hypothetical protein [Legionella drozanskii]|nr:hypothetical protein [Legionella drozanskii]